MNVVSPRAHGRQAGQFVLLAGIIFIAVGVRIAIATTGHNYDFDCWVIVAEIMRHGGNVYAETTRYNYGPGWFSLLHLLDAVTSRFPDPLFAFRMGVAAILSLVDLCLFTVIWRRYDLVRAVGALLSPIAIIISGYHSQFDNLAVLLGMLAVLVYESDRENDPGSPGITQRRFLAYALLGLSLIFKHLLFLFPVYLAIRERSWRAKLWALLVPTGLFLLSFLPYWADGHAGIIRNVFLYRSLPNAPLWNAVFGPAAAAFPTPLQLFLVALLATGYLTRKLAVMDSLLIYTLVLVGFSPATTNQYLAIVVPAIAVFTNIPFLLYMLVATVALIGNNNGLHPQIRLQFGEPIRSWFASDNVYQIPIILLVIGIITMAWQPLIRRARRSRKDSLQDLEAA